jgi:SAM-dependent methyltransferase
VIDHSEDSVRGRLLWLAFCSEKIGALRIFGPEGEIVEDQFIYTCDDVLRMLDSLLEDKGGAWWDEFFAEGSPPRPFFTTRPDENLAEWFAGGLLTPGRVLELGCGQGRNAVYMAGLGCRVDAVDFSSEAIAQAKERAGQVGRQVNFRCCSIFDTEIADGAYDLVYDSGCFHHLPPHRRKSYVALVQRALKPGGRYGLTCFRPEGGGGLSDQQVYERASLGGGLGYTGDRLRTLWDRPPFSLHVLRQMNKTDDQESCFGVDWLWTLLAAKDSSA